MKDISIELKTVIYVLSVVVWLSWAWPLYTMPLHLNTFTFLLIIHNIPGL